MKKLLSVALLIAACHANAQTEKGNWIIGGASNLNFKSNKYTTKSGSSSTDGQKTSSFSVMPSAGYFVIKNLAVGLELEYDITTQNETISNGFELKETKVKTTTLAALPSATYYFTTDSKAFPYIGAGAGYAASRTKTDIVSSDFKTNYFVWKVKGGIAYMITQNVALDLGLNYTQLSSKINGYQDTKFIIKNFSAQIGISVFL